MKEPWPADYPPTRDWEIHDSLKLTQIGKGLWLDHEVEGGYINRRLIGLSDQAAENLAAALKAARQKD